MEDFIRQAWQYGIKSRCWRKGAWKKKAVNYFLDQELGAGDGCVSSLKFKKMIKKYQLMAGMDAFQCYNLQKTENEEKNRT